jgi:Uma2 family endonuclease
MGLAQPVTHLTEEEYLRIERAAEYKSEYYAGEMFAMGGGTSAHSLINANAIRTIGNRLMGKPCVPYDSNLRVKIPSTGLYTYPDIVVICGPLEFVDNERDTVTNPTLLVEVLSDSTEAYDRGKKFAHYRTIPSFREYVLVSQRSPLVEVFLRQPDETWKLTVYRDLDAVARLESIEAELPLSEVYYRVEFPPETEVGSAA